MNNLKTTIGLEIHVQLKTKSKMFCRCNNDAQNKAPNTVVCPVCLGLPGALPVANKQAVEWTIKTGLVLGSNIPKIAKFDRKHYFYPDLPKGYQISQYDEPFCVGGSLEVSGQKVRFNRVHLEEDAGKLIHSNGKSLVDLNRAGTPLMEMVTEPDITSPKQAGDFLRRLQKLVRDEVKVSDADMEKGHMRCDANISVTDGSHMSEIVEIKNLNSFRFVEKALALEEIRLRDEYPNWPAKNAKVTRGYDSKKNITYVQRTKEEAADYRYFPEPDLPPFDSSIFDLEAMKAETGTSLEDRLSLLTGKGIPETVAKIILADSVKEALFSAAVDVSDQTKETAIAIANIIANKFFNYTLADTKFAEEIALVAAHYGHEKISKSEIAEIFSKRGEPNFSTKTVEEMVLSFGLSKNGNTDDLETKIAQIIAKNPAEVVSYKSGKKQLLGFFVGQVMREPGGKADPRQVNEIVTRLLEN